LFVHFADLKADMGEAIRAIAEFIEISVDETVWLDILKHCKFDHMKAYGTKSPPIGGAFWDGSAQTFIHKGQNGRWRDVLTEAGCQAHEARAQQELGPGKSIRRGGSGMSVLVPAATPGSWFPAKYDPPPRNRPENPSPRRDPCKVPGAFHLAPMPPEPCARGAPVTGKSCR
jgi:hypothetical protein